MKRKTKALSVIWEPVNDPDCKEKLRQALKIIFSEGESTLPTPFDEMASIHQYEGEPAPSRGADKERISNAKLNGE